MGQGTTPDGYPVSNMTQDGIPAGRVEEPPDAAAMDASHSDTNDNAIAWKGSPNYETGNQKTYC
jgi:hypothetical protein